MPIASLIFLAKGSVQEVPLDREATTIGRMTGQDVRLEDLCVSRRHATILRSGDVYSIVDEGSSHGTFLNGVRIQSGTLHPGDILQFGSLQAPHVCFHVQGSAASRTISPAAGETNVFKSLDRLPQLDERQPRAAREMEQLTWLLSAARQLNAGGAIDEILTTLLRLTLQLTGVERGFVFLRDGGQMKLACGLNALGERLREDATISHRAIHRAILSDAKFIMSDTLTDESAAGWASVVVNNIRSVYCIPLRKRDSRDHKTELMGLLYLDSQLRPGMLNEVDHQLLDTVSSEAAALLHNALLAEAEYKARRVREELAVAAEIHSGLMPDSKFAAPYASLHARMVPCSEIGGDFFDALVLDDRVCVAIADVSGKGLPAAIVAATLQGIIHAQLLSKQSLPAIAAQVNQFLCTRKVGKYATMVLVKVSSDGQMEYMNCGHVQPLVVRSRNVIRLDEGNLIVGLVPAASYTSAEYLLAPGDRLLLMTDGLVEAENPQGEAFGEPRLSEVARERDIHGILDAVSSFHAASDTQDDCTLVELTFTGLRTNPLPAPDQNSQAQCENARV